MADKRRNQRDDQQHTEDDPKRALSGFLTESTRRARRTLVGVSAAALAVKELNVKLRTFTMFGNTIEVTDDRVREGMCLALSYFLLIFVIYALGDAIRERTAIARAVASSPTMTTQLVMGMRVFLDLIIPAVLGVAAFARWQWW